MVVMVEPEPYSSIVIQVITDYMEIDNNQRLYSYSCLQNSSQPNKIMLID